MTKDQCAKLCGVTPQTVDGWWRRNVDWFPREAVTVNAKGFAIDWDGEKIKAAKELRDSFVSETSDTGPNIQKLKADKLKEELRLLQMNVSKAEFEKARRTKDILPRREYEEFLRDVVTVTRDAIQSLPSQVAKMGATPDQQGRLYAETERIVRSALQQAEEMLARKAEAFE